MYDFMEDYRSESFTVEEVAVKMLGVSEDRREGILSGHLEPSFNEFVFQLSDVDDKYYLSEKVAKYVLMLMELRHSRHLRRLTWMWRGLYCNQCTKCIVLEWIIMFHTTEPKESMDYASLHQGNVLD